MIVKMISGHMWFDVVRCIYLQFDLEPNSLFSRKHSETTSFGALTTGAWPVVKSHDLKRSDMIEDGWKRPNFRGQRAFCCLFFLANETSVFLGAKLFFLRCSRFCR